MWVYEAENYYNDTKIIEEGAVQNSSINFQPVSETDNGGYTCVVKAVNGEVINATFTLNATKCRPNYYGEVCSQVCDCEYGGTCDRWEGCLCPPGRRGDRCQHTCAPGSFGWNCSLTCQCQNNAVCDGDPRRQEGHPNVVKFYGVLTKSDPHYIVVEYAANEELRRYLWGLREQFKVTGERKLFERLGFASGVASGLAELARLKIVHRDIAARNVVISDRKVAKIADFGLSRDVYTSSAYERTNQGGEEELLPLKWMAVESLRDGVYTCESDVWSYGVLLWEIASFGEEPLRWRPHAPGRLHTVGAAEERRPSAAAGELSAAGVPYHQVLLDSRPIQAADA
ncbi:Endothelial cell-specific molecule 1 [Branchiostoma belcheri]|nr:Endothelial cell-specific molecule 1 [Branchiostoma belcheri]